MSLKPAEFDEAVAALRREVPAPELNHRVLKALTHPRRSPRRWRYLAVAGASALLGYILWPRQSAGSAWAWSVQTTNQAETVHRRIFSREGTVIEEMWQEGPKLAFYFRDARNRLLAEERSDGNHIFSFLATNRVRPLPNARATANLHPTDGRRQGYFSSSRQVEALLSDKQLAVESKKRIETPGGPRDQYQIRLKRGYFDGKKYVMGNDLRTTVEADADSGKIRKIVGIDGGITLIEYPSHIDAAVFEPRAQVAQNVEVHDISAEKNRVDATLRRGLATKEGVTLRFLALDGVGNLHALWTGAPVDGKLSHPCLVKGVRAGQPFGMHQFTDGYRMDRRSYPSPVTNGYLEGMALPLLEKIGDRVTLRVFKRGHYVEFSNVPVMRIGDLNSFRVSLGLGKG